MQRGLGAQHDGQRPGPELPRRARGRSRARRWPVRRRCGRRDEHRRWHVGAAALGGEQRRARRPGRRRRRRCRRACRSGSTTRPPVAHAGGGLGDRVGPSVVGGAVEDGAHGGQPRVPDWPARTRLTGRRPAPSVVSRGRPPARTETKRCAPQCVVPDLIWTIVGVLLIIALLIFILGPRLSERAAARLGRSKRGRAPAAHPRSRPASGTRVRRRGPPRSCAGPTGEVGVVDDLDPRPGRAQRRAAARRPGCRRAP